MRITLGHVLFLEVLQVYKTSEPVGGWWPVYDDDGQPHHADKKPRAQFHSERDAENYITDQGKLLTDPFAIGMRILGRLEARNYAFDAEGAAAVVHACADMQRAMMGLRR